MPVTVPPVKFHDIGETEIGDQIHNVMRHHNYGWRCPAYPGMLNDGAQRWPMEMVKVSMGDQNQIGRGKIADLDSGFAQTLQHKQPPGKIGIDDDVLPANLDEEGGVADESQPQFPVGD